MSHEIIIINQDFKILMSNNYSQGAINPNLPTLTSLASLPNSETEDYFEVDHDLHVDAESNQFTDFTFGHEQTWVKYNKTEFWLAKALQYLVLYIIADHRPQVSLLASSQQFSQNPQSAVFSNPVVNRQRIINKLGQKLTTFIKSSPSSSPQTINDNQTHDFLEWIVNIWKYYSQQKAKINMICTKISQKPKAHSVLKNFINSFIRKQSGYGASLKSEEIEQFKEFNENSGLGIELKAVIHDDNFVIITNKVDGVGYCLHVTKNKCDSNQVRVRISSNRKQYMKNFNELINKQQIPIMENPSFGCLSQEKLLENNTLISQEIDTEQQSNQSIEMDDNESIMIESQEDQQKSEAEQQAQTIKEEQPVIKPPQNEIKVTHARIPSFLYMRNKTENTNSKQARCLGKAQKDHPIKLSNLCKKKLKSEQDEQIDGGTYSNRPYSNYMPIAYPPSTLPYHQPYNNNSYQCTFTKQCQGLNKSSLAFSQTSTVSSYATKIPKIKFTYNAITTKPNY